MLLPIDADWEFKVCSVDGSGYKAYPPIKGKRTIKKPWKFCYCIICWEDDEDIGRDYCIFSYDEFSVEAWQTQVNYYNWVYEGRWEVVADGTFDAKDELNAILKKYPTDVSLVESGGFD